MKTKTSKGIVKEPARYRLNRLDVRDYVFDMLINQAEYGNWKEKRTWEVTRSLFTSACLIAMNDSARDEMLDTVYISLNDRSIDYEVFSNYMMEYIKDSKEGTESK